MPRTDIPQAALLCYLLHFSSVHAIRKLHLQKATFQFYAKWFCSALEEKRKISDALFSPYVLDWKATSSGGRGLGHKVKNAFRVLLKQFGCTLLFNHDELLSVSSVLSKLAKKCYFLEAVMCTPAAIQGQRLLAHPARCAPCWYVILKSRCLEIDNQL